MAAPNIYFGYSIQMNEQQCITCGCLFALPQQLVDQRRKDKAYFYCPNGHAQAYMESEADKLRKELAAEKNRVVEANAARWRAEEEKTKAERKLKKTEKRISGGVCPCCNRHFVNVERHMKTKHPDTVAENSNKAKA